MAIEAAILVPLIMVPLFFGTIDVGMAVNSGQNLTSASRSGTQYLLNGGRNEDNLKSIMVDSFDGQLDSSDIVIATACACPNEDALGPDEGEVTQLPYANLRTATLETLAHCAYTCDDGTQERVLVNLSIDYTSNGFYKDYDLNKTVSVRIK